MASAKYIEEKVICYQLELRKQLAGVSTEFSSRHQGTFALAVESHQHTFTPMTTGAFSRNIGKLLSKLKLVTDNLLFMKVTCMVML